MDRFGPSKVVLLRGLLMGAGLVLSSFADSIQTLVLTYGVIGGAGTGSWVSGSVMLIVGVAMLHSGYDMTRM